MRATGCFVQRLGGPLAPLPLAAEERLEKMEIQDKALLEAWKAASKGRQLGESEARVEAVGRARYFKAHINTGPLRAYHVEHALELWNAGETTER